MPIEFHCPGCGKLMRTPDATAGRKGQCPHCGTKVQIPATSLASPEKPKPATSPPSPPRRQSIALRQAACRDPK